MEENATGQGVKVAVIDTGIISTPALIHALAQNHGEELNGLDDDGNGLIDDLFGYDFIANNGHILDSTSTTSHGSSCVGIIAGRSSMSGLRTAIAPDSKIMLLKGGFNLRSLEYLMTNGADIVSMSFMIVNRDLGQIRGLFRNAFEHLSLGGVLAVGGAGNYGPKSRRAMPLGKQIGLPKDIPCVLAIAGVDQSRIQLPFSSEGPCYWEGVQFFSDYSKSNPLPKPDLTAFPTGYPVWNVVGSHKIRRDWKEVERGEGGSLIIGPAGNSFSGPHAAGVAALMLSANPELNPWETSEILRETASDLGPKGSDSIFGAGLIDALAAVREAKKRN
jgi:subtilisin family serine protease